MAKYTIPTGTPVEVLVGQSWQPHTTRRQLEFDGCMSWGLNVMTFREGERTLRVECEKVKRIDEVGS